MMFQQYFVTSHQHQVTLCLHAITSESPEKPSFHGKDLNIVIVFIYSVSSESHKVL